MCTFGVSMGGGRTIDERHKSNPGKINNMHSIFF